MKKHALLIILLVYGFFSLTTLFFWHAKNINAPTGDEPHYLVISSGIAKHGTLEQTTPYREEFKSRKIYKLGLASEEDQPSPENTHAVFGPNGLFNVHNIGLPLLLTAPFLLGGVLGAKLAMVFFGALVVISVWKFSSHFSDSKLHRFWATIATTIALPLIPASNQIYPDILAGLIALTGLYWFFTAHKRRNAGLEALLTATIAFLPWLQIKFSATCVILILSISTKIYLQSRHPKRIARILIITGISYLMLAIYNHYAFGKISGPYQPGALEISKTSLMVLIGLHIDQNQGFILQNPVNLVGILAIGWLYKQNRTFILVWALIFSSLIIPNALHPNWYGGWSFSGRFHWPAAIVFIIPTIYGLLAIARKRKNAFIAITTCGSILQLYFFYQYVTIGGLLYQKGPETHLDMYTIFYYPAQAWLPMLYNSNWAHEHWPNYFWAIMICIFLSVGFLNKEFISRKYKITFPVILSSIFAAGLLLISSKNISCGHKKDVIVFQAAELPSETGRVVDSNRLAEQDTDQPGFINFGPYFNLKKGNYEVIFSYKSSAEETEEIGWIDVFNATSMEQLTRTSIQGTNETKREITIEFKLTQWRPNAFEFRTHWNGISNLEIQEITLKTK